MAAIIAQLTRSARRRRERRTYGTNKCMYSLQQFDRCFDPMTHNRYLLEKSRWEDHSRKIAQEEDKIIQAYTKYKVEKRLRQRTEFSRAACLTEAVIITILILTVPACYIVIEFMFAYGTLYIPPSILDCLLSSNHSQAPTQEANIGPRRWT